MIAIDLTNQQTALPVDRGQLERAVRMILQDASIAEALVSIAVLDDPAMRELNRRHLGRDEATDVLSFLLKRSVGYLDGEVIVSADTAREAAPRFGWSAGDELLLYVIHGTLHLVGYDDATPADQAEMRRREQACLARFGLEPSYEEAGRENRPAGAQRPLDPASGGNKVS